MINLIRINYDTEQPTVSARDLHERLGIGKRFSTWFETNSQGFIKGEDYSNMYLKVRVQKEGIRDVSRTVEDYDLSVDMAKHICLMSRTEKGKQCRQHLIDLEKVWNTPEQIFARALKIADKEIEKLKSYNTVLIQDVDRMKPKEIFADAVSTSKQSILIGELAKILKQNGVDTGEKRLFQCLRDKGYLIKRKGTDFNAPTQKSMELALFEVKETAITHSDGHTTINKTTKVTGKGQQYFIYKFLGNAENKVG